MEDARYSGLCPRDLFVTGGSDAKVVLFEVNASPQILHNHTLGKLAGD